MVTKLYSSDNKQIGKFLMKRVGSGNTDCVKWISNEATVRAFVSCINKKIGSDLMKGLVEAAIIEELDL